MTLAEMYPYIPTAGVYVGDVLAREGDRYIVGRVRPPGAFTWVAALISLSDGNTWSCSVDLSDNRPRNNPLTIAEVVAITGNRSTLGEWTLIRRGGNAPSQKGGS